MTITTYTNEPHGFGVTYDDARLACVDDPLDPRRAAAWSHRIHSEIAASCPHLLSSWDWDAATLREAPGFLEETGAAFVDVTHMYWRGFPIVQLIAWPNPEAPAPRLIEELGLLYTPQQTFNSLVVWPTDDIEALGPTARELWEGFFLAPLEREGRVRTGHKLVNHFHIYLTDEDFLVFVA
jgi:hypothetical protein